MDFKQQVLLGRSGLKVGRLGISSSFGASSEVFEMAFEAGCNYFTYGTFIRGGSPEMRKAVRNLISNGKRDRLVIAVYSYSHTYFLTEYFLKNDLRKLGLDYVDVLILGYYNRKPGSRMMDKVVQLKEKGLVRNLAISSHQRKLFVELEKEKLLDVIHVRYNAVNRGAEQDVFPFMTGQDRPGIVTYTATRWHQLQDPKKMPPGMDPVNPSDVYRFVLSHPKVDVCMVGVKDKQQMRDNLAVLEKGPMDDQELQNMRMIGDHIYGRVKHQKNSLS